MVALAASDVELGAAFTNTKIRIYERITLEEIGQLQTAIKGTLIEIDNSTAHSIIHESIN